MRPSERAASDSRYAAFLQAHTPDARTLKAQSETRLDRMPVFTVLCPAGTKFSETAASLRAQSYPFWELRTAASPAPAARDARITFLPGADVPTLQKGARGAYVCCVDAGDRFTPDALFRFAEAISRAQEVDALYCDEDENSPAGRIHPDFKPDYSPDTLLSIPYIGRPFFVERGVFSRCGGLTGTDEAARYDFTLRACETARQVVHVPRVLFSRGAPRAAVDPGTGRQIVERALVRRRERGMAVGGLIKGSFAVRYGVVGRPVISVIIVSRNDPAALREQIASIEAMCQYPHYEIVVADDHSSDPQLLSCYDTLVRSGKARVLFHGGPHNAAALRNAGARASSGEALLFLGLGVHPNAADCFEQLLMQAQRARVGAAGGKLVTPDGRILHAGLAVGANGLYGSPFRGEPDTASPAEKGRYVNCIRNVSALGGACLMLSRDSFYGAGCFDPSFSEIGWDVEMCLSQLHRGKYNVYTPYARFVQHPLRFRPHPPPAKKNLMRCRDVIRPFSVRGDPYFPAFYGGASDRNETEGAGKPRLFGL